MTWVHWPEQGEFTCEHDFCPDCDNAHEGFQSHQCDLSCGFCPEQALPCPAPEESAPCVNRLDLRCELLPGSVADQRALAHQAVRLTRWCRIEEGQCELLIAAGSASCENDFCGNCEGSTGVHQGDGQGGHQHGECDRTCGLCPAAAVASANCSDEPIFYPRSRFRMDTCGRRPGRQSCSRIRL
eukprot:COSAG02_NODE_13009_length_1461_cov_1.169604_2_plen_184_part_00